MALTAALKAQIAAWYKALQEQIPDFIPRALEKKGGIWRLKPPPALGKRSPI